jgi:hypothetical protein
MGGRDALPATKEDNVSLNQETGKLNWYYQGVPNDFHDWDMQVSPIYVEETSEPMVIDSGKMGFVYSMNPETGKLNWKTSVGIHNGKDNDGPLALEGRLKKPKLPYKYLPGLLGGVETNMAAAEGMAFVPINNLQSTFKTYTEPIASQEPPSAGKGELVAVNLETGKIAWEDKFPSSAYGDATYSEGVVYTTIFGGEVIAVEAKTGKELWKAKLPAGANSPVAIDGEYLVTAAGYPEGKGQQAAVVAYKLGATGKPGIATLVAEGPKAGEEENSSGEESEVEKAENENGGGEAKEAGGEAAAASPTFAAGEEVFDTTCSSCHTLAAAGRRGGDRVELVVLGAPVGRGVGLVEVARDVGPVGVELERHPPGIGVGEPIFHRADSRAAIVFALRVLLARVAEEVPGPPVGVGVEADPPPLRPSACTGSIRRPRGPSRPSGCCTARGSDRPSRSAASRGFPPAAASRRSSAG